MALLATTALEWSWGEGEPLVFLGEWCRRHERSACWRSREHVVVRNHWDDRSKLHRDYSYLKILHDDLVGELARLLARLHGLERSKRYWQTLLDPWLARYLGVVFDRWESVRVAFEEHDCSQSIARTGWPRPPLRDHFQFLEAVTSDEWNHDLYADILRFEYAERCALRSPSAGAGLRSDDAPVHGGPNWLKWRRAVAGRIDSLCGLLSQSNQIAFIQSYFPLSSLARLNLCLGQLPVPRLGEFVWPNASLVRLAHADAELRAQIALQRKPTCRFESFLHERIRTDLLQVIVESFAWMGDRAAAIRSRPKVIFSASAHWFNDLFKRWLAERVREGAVFVAMEHGGSIPPRFSAMTFEEDVSDVRTTWAVPYHPKHVRLPPNRMVGRRSRRARGRQLMIVGSESPRYAYDLSSTPIGGQTLVGFEYVCRLHDALEERVRSAFLVKPYPDLGWRLHERFAERLGAGKVCAFPDLDGALNLARVAVCTYPQTTFSQAMTCGAPTLLVYPRHLWETVPQFDGLIEALQAAQIVFFDPEAAASHINQIWSEPQAWWNSATVREARRRFEMEALDMRADWSTPWLEFARSIVAREGRERACARGGQAD
jgi:putative transferase (TIGR04331 family)